MARSRVRAFVAEAWAVVSCFIAASSSCAPSLSLENRRCPCASGYHCCDSIDTCRPSTDNCPIIPGDAGGASDAGRLVVARDGASDGGYSPPHWQTLDPASLQDFEVRSPCDLEIDANGAPYVAFRTCKGCDSLGSGPAVVLRYDGSRWKPLTPDSLPSSPHNPALVISADGAPHVLIDNTIRSFNGTVWEERLPSLPATLASDRNLELDAQGKFCTTLYDGSTGQLSVARQDGVSWQVLGSGMPSDPNGERLASGAGALWLAHTAGRGTSLGGAKLSVRRFDGRTWAVVNELPEPGFFDFVVAPDGTFYVTQQTSSPGPAPVMQGRGAAWTEILNLSPLGTPSLRIGPDGALYAAYLMDGFVNVSRWAGSKWVDFDPAGLGTASSVPALRIAAHGASIVPYLCFLRGTDLHVVKYE